MLRKDLFPLKRSQSGVLVDFHYVYTSGLSLKDTPGSVNNATISYNYSVSRYHSDIFFGRKNGIDDRIFDNRNRKTALGFQSAGRAE